MKSGPGPVELDVSSMAFGGHAVGRVEGKVFFVRGALPGERVRARVDRVRRSHAFAETVEVLRPSPDRRNPPCPAFGRCGGCSFLHWSYPAQLRAKTEWLREALRRFPAVAESLPDVEPAPEMLRFRNRMGYSVFSPTAGTVMFGLHAARSRRIVPADACLLPTRGMLDVCRQFVGAVSDAGDVPYRIDVRESAHTQERMLAVHALRRLRNSARLAERLHPHCAHLYLCTSAPGPSHRVRRSFQRLAGCSVLTERVSGLDFEITPDTFFQTNTRQAEKLVEYVREEADRLGSGRVLDLFAGTGLFSLSLAAPGRSVWGMEASGPAIAVARRNVERNNTPGVEFVRGAAESATGAFGDRTVDLAVVDPPRSGLTPDARRELLALRPGRILYISCNPATLSRDLQDLNAGGYEVRVARGFDLFPQTSHVECVVTLGLREQGSSGSPRFINPSVGVH